MTKPSWNGLLVLSYHRIGQAAGYPYDRAAWSATPDVLDAHLSLLVKHFEVIGPREIDAARRARRGRFIVLTFDDGYRDSFDEALPLLRSHGVPAGFFPITGLLDRPHVPWWDEVAWMVRTSTRGPVPAGQWLDAPVAFDEPDREGAVRALLLRYRTIPGCETEAFLDFIAERTGSGRHPQDEASERWLSWDMVRLLHEAGMTIGAHTATHPVLTMLSQEEQWSEIASCRRRIEAEVGEPSTIFAYPAGRFDDRTRACLAAEGVELAFAHSGGYYRLNQPWDPYDVRRTPISRRVDVKRLRDMLTLPDPSPRS
jgi:peptidoglycan/xylan/chitin deacetylase (PgdA/CDA1 family)